MGTDALKPLTDLVWHYTDTAALISILTTHRLRASSAAYMNDANEMITHQLAMKSAYRRVRESLTAEEQELLDRRYNSDAGHRSVHENYLVSASENGDLLTLWRNYGGNGAFSIGFDPSVKLRPVLQRTEDKHPFPPKGYYEDAEDFTEEGEPFRLYDPDQTNTLGGKWKRVHYVSRDGIEAHEEQVRRDAEFLVGRKHNPLKFKHFVDFTYLDPDNAPNLEKDEAFSDEKEVRIIVSVMPDWKFVKYRSGPFGLTPYVELAAMEKTRAENGDVALSPTFLPIRRITLGPSRRGSELEQRSLRALLDANGYGDVEIDISEIPYR
ncbi:DUF2971 domain-containing protein [Leucobacter sp. W1153]|uniref:DUF2971 domain-containing protein n=1 Tax=Leucobacter sp. W1153 TaxID=3439064 RepID=UPI003F405037